MAAGEEEGGDASHALHLRTINLSLTLSQMEAGLPVLVSNSPDDDWKLKVSKQSMQYTTAENYNSEQCHSEQLS